MIERKKLFSSSGSKVRRKLFSVPTVILVCRDCGTEIKSGDGTTTEYCPTCGGKRFDIPSKVQEIQDEENKAQKPRRSLFSSSKDDSQERYFSETPQEGTIEAYLKEFSGKEITQGQTEKLFSGIDLEREGLATRQENGNLKIFSMSDEIQRMYSSLKITIIKELELDPPCGTIPEAIEDLKENHPEIGPREIVILKKAHGLPKENLFSETEEWIADSGIREDLKNELEGKDFTEDELKNIIEEKYEDAPEGTIEVLKEVGLFEEGPDGILHIKN